MQLHNPRSFLVGQLLNLKDPTTNGYFQQHCADNNGTLQGV